MSEPAFKVPDIALILANTIVKQHATMAFEAADFRLCELLLYYLALI